MAIKVHLSKILGERKMKVAELARQSGLDRPGLHKIYHEKHDGISYKVLSKLCEVLEVSVGDLLEYVPDNDDDNKSKS